MPAEKLAEERLAVGFYLSGHPLDQYERVLGKLGVRRVSEFEALVLRGADSDLLPRATWLQMGERGPRAKLAEIQGVGHAPMFLTEEQISITRDFLLSA